MLHLNQHITRLGNTFFLSKSQVNFSGIYHTYKFGNVKLNVNKNLK